MTVSLSFAATILLKQKLRLAYGDSSRHPAPDWIRAVGQGSKINVSVDL